MPPVDPIQLLNCLRVLLNEDTGGFMGHAQAIECARLMPKFSFKSVSRIVFTMILKNSTEELLNVFMDANGWDITFTWLNNGIDTCNTMLVIDVLTILHDVPVTIERLQSNPGPKLVKSLSRFNFNQEIKSLAQELVNKWLLVIRRNMSCNMSSNEESLMKPETLGSFVSRESSFSVLSDSVRNKTLEQKYKTKSLNTQDKSKIEKKKILDFKDKGYSLKIAKEEKDKISEKYKINNDTNESKGEKHYFEGSFKNPFLKIIGKMSNGNIVNDELIKIGNSNIPKNVCADTNKPFLLPSSKSSVPCLKTGLDKTNYSINIQSQKPIGEKKAAVKTFQSKFRSTGLEKVAPPPPYKSKLQSEKSVKSNVECVSSSKAEKRTLSPKCNCSAEKKRKNFSSNNERSDSADGMQPKTTWRHLNESMVVELLYDFDEDKAKPRCNSQEKIAQTLRERSVSAVFYSNKNEVPDSPEEPDKSEISLHSRPINLPIDDITYPESSFRDISDIPWPEAKDNQPPPVEKFPTVVYVPVLTHNCYYSNQINWSLAPENMLEMTSFSNRMSYYDNRWFTQIHSGSSQQVSQLCLQPLLYLEQPHQPPLPQHRPPLPQHRPPLPQYQPPLPQHRPLLPQHQPPLPQHRPPLPQHQPPLPQHQPPLPQHQPPLPQHRPPLPQHQPPLPQHQPPLPQHQPPLPSQPPPLPQHQPPLPSQPPPLPMKPPPLPQQQLQLPKLVEKHQWMNSYEPNFQHDQKNKYQFSPNDKLSHSKIIKHEEKNKNSSGCEKNTCNCIDILCHDETSQNKQKDSQPSYRSRKSVCRYYARGLCFKNTNCPFLH